MNKISSLITLLLTFGLFACNDSRNPPKAFNLSDFDKYWARMTQAQEDSLFDLYYTSCDTVISHNDTTWIINRKYDTTIVHTGIFYYLRYDYPVAFAGPSTRMTEIALDFEKQGNSDSASTYFKTIVAYVDTINHQQHSGEFCADANSLLEIGVNNAILASFACTRLGDTTKALDMLKPWLANAEAHAGIYGWFARLCRLKYGESAWTHELNTCYNTLHRLEDDHLPETSDWAVKIFGASVGLGNADDPNVTSRSNIDRTINWIFRTNPDLR
ncbi:hypothetical protein L3C95_10245 [Chitinophaga filiformis]|uniref:hypothetical protein n=1 Tax=Chitinophaga filiformis TaxID=104663 RepID=UPI001F484862|nr:hypothetical protein [Chitinophaga filiformis]MCF6402827.1 hypothetical protein [Chitinophaga filiformis]MCF6403255.1 hypothetical protein [Chitinophaga filiformis]